MRIKGRKRQSFIKSLLPQSLHKDKVFIAGSILVAVIIVIVVYQMFPHIFLRLKFNPNVEKITIDIKFKDYEKLSYNRMIAKTNAYLLTDKNSYVPAQIRYKDKTLKAFIRLKGDSLTHINSKQWSYRVKIKGDNTFKGMKRFSLHHPRERNYLHEWVYHKMLKREGVVSPRYDFLKVTVNGDNLGLYALEEHFERHLIENNQNREGPIIKFNEDFMWIDRIKSGRQWNSGFQSLYAWNVDAFKMNKIMNTPELYEQFKIGYNLLESFRNETLPTHKVFDIKKLAKYFAILDLTGSFHSAAWHNIRFYYNPVTSLLEPIGFDGEGGREANYILGSLRLKFFDKNIYNPFFKLFFEDVVFFEEYVKTLERISEKSYLDEFFKETDSSLNENLNIIQSEFPSYEFSTDMYYKNQKMIRHTFDPVKAVSAHFNKFNQGYVEIKAGNITSLPVEIVDMVYENSVLEPVERYILPRREAGAPIRYQKLIFRKSSELNFPDQVIPEFNLHYKIPGSSITKLNEVFRWPSPEKNLFEKDIIRAKANFDSFDFITVNESAKKILIKPGKWVLQRNLIIPAGYTLICLGGTKLNLINSAKIISYSPVEFLGDDTDPIEIVSENLTGQGIAIMKTDKPSKLEYVVLNNLSNPSQEGWSLTGAVTFYEADVIIKNCKFLNNKSEDSLNIIRSHFIIDQTLFSNTTSDAVDVDFGTGRISHSHFVNSGNDAIDISGSKVELSYVFIDTVGDKGLSVGEASSMLADMVEIKNAILAIAVKDFSSLEIKNTSIFESEVGFALYQKKSEFGPAQVTAKVVRMNQVKNEYLVEEKSKLWVDGKSIKSNQEIVKQIQEMYLN